MAKAKTNKKPKEPAKPSEADLLARSIERIAGQLERLELRVDKAKERSLDLSPVVARWASQAAYFARRVETSVSGKSEAEINDSIVSDARLIIERGYHEDVKDVAEDFTKRWLDGEFDDRDSALEDLRETIDGHGRLVYTRSAQECMLVSNNSDAHFQEYGSQGVADGGGINWSRIAYAAFEADVQEAVSEKGINLNEEPPSKITGHAFVPLGGASQAEICDDTGEDDELDIECAHRSKGKYDCGKPKRLHDKE